MTFQTRERLEADGDDSWRLLEPLVYRGAVDTWTIPAGFRTDYASVPWWALWLVPRTGRHGRAAILHDYLRRPDWQQLPDGTRQWRPPVSTADADGVFRRVLREDGVTWLRRWLMWSAVRVASGMTGASFFDWQNILGVALCVLAVVGLVATVVLLGLISLAGLVLL